MLNQFISMENKISEYQKFKKVKCAKEFRPITLLNTDMKTFNKIITNRIKNSIQNLIYKNETCIIQGRKITDNLITVRNLISYYEVKRNKNAAFLSLDFKKALDKVLHENLLNILEKLLDQRRCY